MKRVVTRKNQGTFKDKPKSSNLVAKGTAKGTRRTGRSGTGIWEKTPSARRDGLIDEFLRRKKTSIVVDSRIGERSSVPEEEKIARRIAKEKTKQYKKRVDFNLPDDDDVGLTHKGKAIEQMERYDDPRDHSGSEDELLDKEFVGEAHFGGFLKMKPKEDTETGEKSRKEIIEELIMSNKARKLEKAKQGDEYLSKVGDLNSLFKEDNVLSLVQTVRTKKEEMESMLTAKPAADPNKLADFGPHDKAFGQIVRELKFEAKPARVAPVDPSAGSNIVEDSNKEVEAYPAPKVPAQIPGTFDQYLQILKQNKLHKTQVYDSDQFVRVNMALINLHIASHRGHLYTLCDYLLQLNIETALGNEGMIDRMCLIESLVKIFHRISEISPDRVALAEYLISKVNNSHTILEGDDDGDDRGKTFTDSDVALLYLCFRVFGTNKMQRRLHSPVLSLLATLVSSFKVKDSNMAYRLLLLCHCGYLMIQESKRYMPEIVTCIHLLLTWLDTPKKLSKQETYKSFPLKEVDLNGTNFETYKLIFPILSLITPLFKLYSTYPATIHIFKPIRDALMVLKGKDKQSFNVSFPSNFDMERFRAKLNEIILQIDNFSPHVEPPRTKVALPKPLRLYEPLFEETFTGKKRVGSRDKQDRDRLAHKIKSEHKGAIRELKKDSATIARVQQQEQAHLDNVRKRKVNLIMGSLANQEGDYKKVRRGK